MINKTLLAATVTKITSTKTNPIQEVAAQTKSSSHSLMSGFHLILHQYQRQRKSQMKRVIQGIRRLKKRGGVDMRGRNQVRFIFKNNDE